MIYPRVKLSDFNSDLFPKIRNLIRGYNDDHPWLPLIDEQLLQKAGLWKKDFATGQEGYTLAAVLLLGKDETIQQILPHYKIDALVRKQNKERFDDRLYCTTNLIDAYDELMDFVAKHLSDPFYLEGTQRRSLRGIIFREIIVNMIVHREYINAHPATFIIYGDRVETENANNPHGEGLLTPTNFSPFPKNPSIAKFFMQLGRFDELGSGILNVNKNIEAYSGKDNPQFIEGDTFKTIIPTGGVDGKVAVVVNEGTIEEAIEGVTAGLIEAAQNRLVEIVNKIYQKPGIKVVELQEILDVSNRTMRSDIERLEDFLEYKGSKKTGGYFLKDTIKHLLDRKKM